ncbi:MAG: nuclear transport factor 2 family protein [Bacteroidetes bacterium]|nr:nuclear transport factor 2 family protein [Bacteroidota bacterium]
MESLSVKNLSIAKTWLACFNEHNLENLLALYDEHAIHFSPKLKVHRPETNGLIKGKTALRDWWKDAFQRLPQLQYREVSLTANEHRVFMEYTRIVPGEAEINVAEVLEIENGLIVRSRVYHG